MHIIFKPIQLQKHLLTTFVFLTLILVLGVPQSLAASPPETLAREVPSQMRPQMPLFREFQAEQSSALTESSLGILRQYSLVAEDAQAFDEFGWAVATDGYTAVIGARNEDPDKGAGPITNAGAAYVFVRNGNVWIQQAKLVAKDASAYDAFGTSVVVDGNTILIGAPGVDDVNDDNEQIEDVGAAYVFVRQGSDWKQQAKLASNDGAEEDVFGVSVALDGKWAVIGASSNDLGPLPDTGAAYIFRRSNERSWKQTAKLIANSPFIGDAFGIAVAIQGDTVVVGATETNPIGSSGEGKAFVFNRMGEFWVQTATLRAKDARNGDGFGRAIAISDDLIVIGARSKDPDLGNGRITNAGAAYVYNQIGNTWKQEAMLLANDPSSFAFFGSSVGIYGNTVVVGAEGKIQAGNDGAGAAYVFTRSKRTWQQQTKAVTDPAFEDDNFGNAIGVHGNWVLVGANGRDPRSLNRAGEAFMVQLGGVQLPDTGFAPGKITQIKNQPLEKAYQSYGELSIEVPSIDVRMSIVGVPRGGNGWDVRWLWDQAGYLDGTAFPTWPGNTGIAAHAVLPNGTDGPFAKLDALKWGDQVIIHAWGQKYIYEVRQSMQVFPNETDVLDHEELDWVTLITCQDFDDDLETYYRRKVVRAVLVGIEDG